MYRFDLDTMRLFRDDTHVATLAADVSLEDAIKFLAKFRLKLAVVL